MTSPTSQDTHKGQAVYTPLLLKVYNWYVLGFSNRFVWRCKTSHILKFYNEHISSNHLDVGVGTGYLLDHCQFPTANPKLALIDLNEHCLVYTSKLLSRYHPVTYHEDIYRPLTMVDQQFDSIGINYVLHCLPGDFTQKSAVIKNLKTCLRPGGVLFGSTILSKDQQHNCLGKKLLTIYNNKGIFGNWQDGRVELERMLGEHFDQVDIKVIGAVALFAAR